MNRIKSGINRVRNFDPDAWMDASNSEFKQIVRFILWLLLCFIGIALAIVTCLAFIWFIIIGQWKWTVASMIFILMCLMIWALLPDRGTQ